MSPQSYRKLCARPGKLGALKKEIWVLLRAPLFLGKWCGVIPYFFYAKKKKLNIKIHDQNISLSLIE